MNKRDTQFAGFAEALFENLPWNEINIDMEWPGWQEKWELYIAQRAYDLVEHACREINNQQMPQAICLHPNAMLREIPDLTELPKEDTNA